MFYDGGGVDWLALVCVSFAVVEISVDECHVNKLLGLNSGIVKPKVFLA